MPSEIVSGDCIASYYDREDFGRFGTRREDDRRFWIAHDAPAPKGLIVRAIMDDFGSLVETAGGEDGK